MTHSLDPETSHAPDHVDQVDHADHAPGQGAGSGAPTAQVPPAPAPPLADTALAEEIELYAEVVVAATESDGPMPEGELDRVLGVDGGPTAG